MLAINQYLKVLFSHSILCALLLLKVIFHIYNENYKIVL